MATVKIQPEQVQTEPISRFETKPSGVYWIAVKTKENGEIAEREPIRLCDYVNVIGQGDDSNDTPYIIIEHKRRNRSTVSAIKREDVNTGKFIGQFGHLAIGVQAGKNRRERLADHLNEQANKQRNVWRIIETTGWQGESYILPNGKNITQGKEKVYFNGAKSNGYTLSGSLNDWQTHIAQMAQNNSRICLALGTAFAAPLLHLLQMESGGFHLRGNSSIGKTTLVNIALCVWGNPRELVLSWNGTGLGLQNIAAARNDNFVVLDEIGQAQKKAVSDVAYSLFNGINRIQAHKDGGNRATIRWRILALSTGEVSPEHFLSGSSEWNAGQSVRLPTLEADASKGYGVFDALHHYPNAAKMADDLNEQAKHYHGTAGVAFVQSLTEQTPQQARALMNEFCAKFPECTGQAARVMKRFALVAAALELAQNITALPPYAGFNGIAQCFEEWLTNNGEDFETRRIVQKAVDWFETNVTRLTDFRYRASPNLYVKNHAGFYDYDTHQYYLMPSVLRDEIAAPYNAKRTGEILIAKGMIAPDSKGNHTSVKRISHDKTMRVVVFIASEPQNEPN